MKEGIDLVSFSLQPRNLRLLRGNERPVLLIDGALLDPLLDRLLLVLGQLSVGVGRRHDLIVVLGGDALPGFTVREISGNDGPVPSKVGQSAFRRIKPEVRLPLFLVEAVAGEAVV